VWWGIAGRLIPPPPPPLELVSVIISDFPAIFAEFKEKEFPLLWRGRRDGFGDGAFHSRCDGHANTLTVILDTDGNIFGGFTPVEWESQGGTTGDPSQKSFLFTLTNPHNVPARRFALKAEVSNPAIVCNSRNGPHLSDIAVWDQCNANTNSCSILGCWYTNDTGLDGRTFFTGSPNVQVKEIEVFEIRN
jgi:hypothetical protein